LQNGSSLGNATPDAPSAAWHLNDRTRPGVAMDRMEFPASYYSVEPALNAFIHCPQTSTQRLLNNA